MVNKATAYELSKHLPSEITQQFLSNPDSTHTLIDVGRVLKQSHLPGWLVYAIDHSDHTITNLDIKIIKYVSDETIEEVALKYAEAENPIINLNQPGERDWMQENPMKPYQEQFESEYNEAISSVQTVFTEVFEDHYPELVAKYSRQIAESIIDEIDMFSWMLYCNEASGSAEKTNQIVAEWLVSEIKAHDLAQVYLIEVKEVSNYHKFLEELEKVIEDMKTLLENTEIEEFGGRIPLYNALPTVDEKVAQIRDEYRNKQV